MSSAVAKSGWLYRQSSLLKKWKKRWFVLYQDGFLRYFDSDRSQRAEEAVLIPSQCVFVQMGADVRDITPPVGMMPDFLIQLNMRGGHNWIMCGESVDDAKAWELAIEQARVTRPLYRHASQPTLLYRDNSPIQIGGTSVRYVYPPYNYPGEVYYGSYPEGTYVAGPGQTTVIVREQYYNRRYRPYGGDMFVGMAAGAMLGSLMWTPFLWW